MLAQSDKSSIAVLPLTHVAAVSEDEANTLTLLLETGIVQAGRLQVVERRQIAAVLEEQRFSADDYTDDSVAVEIGRLLSSQLIVIGTVSKIGSSLYIIAKIIDVTTGAAREAARVTADTIEELADRAEDLGRNLTEMLVQEEAQLEKEFSADSPDSDATDAVVAVLESIPQLSAEEFAARRRKLTIGGWVLSGLGAVSATGALAAIVGHVTAQQPDDRLMWKRIGLGLGIISGLFSAIGTLVLLER